MFTGIIKEIGKIKRKKEIQGKVIFEIFAPKIINEIKKSSSVAVNGVCLTVIKKEKESFFVELGKETLKKTTLEKLFPGKKVNLEPSLKFGDELGGHIVLGHIDGKGKIKKIKKFSNGWLMEISFPKDLKKYIIKKGSIACDGVSLTINDVKKESFEVFLIPFTLKNTILGEKKIGDEINLEIDIFARYLLEGSNFIRS